MQAGVNGYRKTQLVRVESYKLMHFVNGPSLLWIKTVFMPRFFCNKQKIGLIQSQRVTQKYLVVTCNHAARAKGVTKFKRIEDAKRLCPNLFLRPSEDLTLFRTASCRIFEATKAFFDVFFGVRLILLQKMMILTVNLKTMVHLIR